MKRFGILIALVFIGLSACTWNKWELIAPKNAVPCDSSGIISYATTIAPIINANCGTSSANSGSCHGTTPGPRAPVFTTWAVVNTYCLNGQILNDITHSVNEINPMPLGKPQMSDCNIGLIRKWINAGSLNN